MNEEDDAMTNDQKMVSWPFKDDARKREKTADAKRIPGEAKSKVGSEQFRATIERSKP